MGRDQSAGIAVILQQLHPDSRSKRNVTSLVPTKISLDYRYCGIDCPYNQGAWHVTSNGGADHDRRNQRSNSRAKRPRAELSNQTDPPDCSLSPSRRNPLLLPATRPEKVP